MSPAFLFSSERLGLPLPEPQLANQPKTGQIYQPGLFQSIVAKAPPVKMCVLRSNCKHFLILVSLLMECSVLAWLGTYCILQISTCGQWTSFGGTSKGKNRRVCVCGVCGEACVSKMKTLVFSSYLKGRSQFSLFPVYFFRYSQRTTSDTSGYQMHVGFSHNNE